jgi:CBS domain containing-hemolysin-like protein
VTRKSDAFVQDCVLGFGFFGGLFTRIGVDPEEVTYRALLKVAIPNNDSLVSLAIILIVVATTLAGIFGTLHMAGWPGLFVVGTAWVSGFIITVNSSATVGAILLIAVMIVGPIVCDNHSGSGGF